MKILSISIAILLALLSDLPNARACGAMFGHDVTVLPAQSIIVTKRDQIETYIFNPKFCGAAKDFGLILPIPTPFFEKPQLADISLYEQLEKFTEPETVEECESSGIGCGSAKGGDNDSVGRSNDAGVDVIETGTVGVFDYTLLKADSLSAFTDWLTQNGFPFDKSYDAYAPYIVGEWHFIAFKISLNADTSSGKRLCGDLGPIQVSFRSTDLVVPARITTANKNNSQPPVWRIFAISEREQAISTMQDKRLYFSHALVHSELGDFPAIKSISRDGERLTVFDVTFSSSIVSDDIVLSDSSYQADFRSKKYVYKDCGGCQSSTTGRISLLCLLVPLLFWPYFRRRRPRTNLKNL